MTLKISVADPDPGFLGHPDPDPDPDPKKIGPDPQHCLKS